MTESMITEKIVAYLKRLRERGEPIWWAKIHGGPMQRAGLPDLLILHRGRLLAVEIKRPGKHPTRLQAHTLAALRAAGAEAIVATCVEEIQSLFS